MKKLLLPLLTCLFLLPSAYAERGAAKHSPAPNSCVLSETQLAHGRCYDHYRPRYERRRYHRGYYYEAPRYHRRHHRRYHRNHYPRPRRGCGYPRASFSLSFHG